MKKITIVNYTNYHNYDEFIPKLNKLKNQFIFEIYTPEERISLNYLFGNIADTRSVFELLLPHNINSEFTIFLLDTELTKPILVENNLAILSIFSPVENILFSKLSLKIFSFICLLFESGITMALNSLSPFNEYEALKEILNEHNNIYYSCILKFESIESDKYLSDKHVVLISHGYNTHAYWADNAQQVLKSEFDIDSLIVRIPFITEIMLVLPIYRNIYAKTILKSLNTLKENYPNHKISIITHSYGTLLVTKALEYAKEINSSLIIHNIVFNASIEKQNYDWNIFLNEDGMVKVNKILNICGDNDFLPVLSRVIVPGTGYSGTFFFSKSDNIISNIRLANTNHSDMLEGGLNISIWGKFICDDAVDIPRTIAPTRLVKLFNTLTKYLPSNSYIYIMILIILYNNFDALNQYLIYTH